MAAPAPVYAASACPTSMTATTTVVSSTRVRITLRNTGLTTWPSGTQISWIFRDRSSSTNTIANFAGTGVTKVSGNVSVPANGTVTWALTTNVAVAPNGTVSWVFDPYYYNFASTIRLTATGCTAIQACASAVNGQPGNVCA